MSEKRKFLLEGKPVYFQEYEDREPDVIKLWHEFVCAETGRSLHTIDWTPYGHMSDEDVQLYLNLGCPKRITCGPLNREDLDKIAASRTMNPQHEKTLPEPTKIELPGDKTVYVLKNGRAYRVINSRKPRVNKASEFNASDVWEGGLTIQMRQDRRWVYLDTAPSPTEVAASLKGFEKLPRLPEQEEPLENLIK